jgi:hypothetical protein
MRSSGTPHAVQPRTRLARQAVGLAISQRTIILNISGCCPSMVALVRHIIHRLWRELFTPRGAGVVDRQVCERRPWPIDSDASNNRHRASPTMPEQRPGSPAARCTPPNRELVLTRFLRSKLIPDCVWKLRSAVAQLHSFYASPLLPKSHMSDTQRPMNSPITI